MQPQRWWKAAENEFWKAAERSEKIPGGLNPFAKKYALKSIISPGKGGNRTIFETTTWKSVNLNFAWLTSKSRVWKNPRYLYSRPTFPICGHLTMWTHCLGHCGRRVPLFGGHWNLSTSICWDKTIRVELVSVLQMSIIFSYLYAILVPPRDHFWHLHLTVPQNSYVGQRCEWKDLLSWIKRCKKCPCWSAQRCDANHSYMGVSQNGGAQEPWLFSY